jgi:hypothetical protein
MIFNKFLDPESVVRESEFARTPENMPLINRFKAAFIKLKKGGILTDDDRQALMRMSKRIYDVSEKRHKETLKQYRGYAEKMQLNPDLYLPPIDANKDPLGIR